MKARSQSLKLSVLRQLIWLPMVFALGCVQAPEKSEPVAELQPLLFPPPPEEPRFVYERMVRSSADIKVLDQKTQWRQMLTGETGREQGLSKPFDVAVCHGQIFVSDTVQRKVLVFDVPGRRYFEIGLDDPGTLRKPLGLATDADCNLYVADGTTRFIMVYDQAGQFLKSLGGQEWFERLSHVAVDAEGNRVFGVDTGGVRGLGHRVRVFDAQSGKHLFDIGTRGEGPGQFNLPRDAEIGGDGKLYVVDGGNFRVQVLDKDGNFIRSIGTLGRQYGQFARPKGVATDVDGNVYVSDAAHGNFQIFNSNGELLLFVGSRSEKFDRGTYMLPAGLDVDEDGRVYMIDQYFRKLDVYRPASLGETEGFVGGWNRR